MYNETKVKKSQIAGWLAQTFPEYHGRKFAIRVCDTITFMDLNWAGGTRNVYRSITANGTRQLPNMSYVNPAEGKTVDIPDGVVIAVHTMALGIDLGVTFYVKANPQLA